MTVTKKFHALFTVRPTTDHPTYYEWLHGVLGIVLTGQHDFEAEERAKAIVGQLPFEVIECVNTTPWTGPRNDLDAIDENMLMALGFTYYIIRVPPEEFGEKPPEEWGEPPGACPPGGWSEV